MLNYILMPGICNLRQLKVLEINTCDYFAPQKKKSYTPRCKDCIHFDKHKSKEEKSKIV